jgi:hypothetical protein
VLVEDAGDQFVVRAPVTQRGDAIGLLEIALSAAPADAVVRRVSRAAHTLAFVVIANRRHTDLFECACRFCWCRARQMPYIRAPSEHRRVG